MISSDGARGVSPPQPSLPFAPPSPPRQTVSFSQELILGQFLEKAMRSRSLSHSRWYRGEGGGEIFLPPLPSPFSALCGARRGRGCRETPVRFRDINFTISLERFQSKVLCDMITQGELSWSCLMKQILCLMILRGIKCS